LNSWLEYLLALASYLFAWQTVTAGLPAKTKMALSSPINTEALVIILSYREHNDTLLSARAFPQ
jgi:hypothetical protein